MLTAIGVGSGPAQPLAAAADDEKLARDFYHRVGHDADDIAFTQFTRARSLPKETVQRVRNLLATRYRMPGFVVRRVQEDFGFGIDADGSGRTPNGGSATDDYDTRRAGISKSDYTCPKCGEPMAEGGGRCPRCSSVKAGGSAGELRGTNAGADGVHNADRIGYVRIPGGPVDSNERCLVVNVLTPSLVEVSVAGTTQTHSWSTASSGIAYGLSAYGKATSSRWVSLVNEWLWQHALPGDKLVVTLDGRDAYVTNRDGYQKSFRLG